MSADDQDRPRKTLTIKKTARDAHAEEAPKRVRTGARARLVAQNERTKESIERQKDPEGYQRRQEEEAARYARKPAAGGRGSADRGASDRSPSGRGPASRGQEARGPGSRGPSSDRNRGDSPRRDAAPSTRSGRPPQRAPRLDDQYIAPATPAGRFYDPFEDDGPAPEFAPEPDYDDAADAGHAPAGRHDDAHDHDHRDREPIVEVRTRRPRETRQAEVFKVFAPCPQAVSYTHLTLPTSDLV